MTSFSGWMLLFYLYDSGGERIEHARLPQSLTEADFAGIGFHERPRTHSLPEERIPALASLAPVS